jgi:hypothetical protein
VIQFYPITSQHQVPNVALAMMGMHVVNEEVGMEDEEDKAGAFDNINGTRQASNSNKPTSRNSRKDSHQKSSPH